MPMYQKLHPKDASYFRSYAHDARLSGRSLSNHYLHIQSAHTGGTKEGDDYLGLSLASRYIDLNMTILVVGCGAGSEAQWLLEHGYKHITGLDTDQHLLESFAKRFGLPTVCADMRNTGLEIESYDVVISHRSLHHLFYPFSALEELARIARLKVCLANEPLRSPLKQFWRKFSGGRIISAANIYEYQFDAEDVCRYMLFNGFECRRFGRFWESGSLRRTSLRLLNSSVRGLGNRFSAVFERILRSG